MDAVKKSAFTRPVVRLKKALHGHPDSGHFWEGRCDKNACKVGIKPISDNWNSCYFHNELKRFLTFDVDDFHLAGPKQHLKQGLQLLRKGVPIEAETQPGF